MMPKQADYKTTISLSAHYVILDNCWLLFCHVQ